MAGIVSFGSYIPTYRLPRDVIAKEWGTPSLGGERAIANFDEDSLSMAVNASVDALGDRDPQARSPASFLRRLLRLIVRSRRRSLWLPCWKRAQRFAR